MTQPYSTSDLTRTKRHEETPTIVEDRTLATGSTMTAQTSNIVERKDERSMDYELGQLMREPVKQTHRHLDGRGVVRAVT